VSARDGLLVEVQVGREAAPDMHHRAALQRNQQRLAGALNLEEAPRAVRALAERLAAHALVEQRRSRRPLGEAVAGAAERLGVCVLIRVVKPMLLTCSSRPAKKLLKSGVAHSTDRARPNDPPRPAPPAGHRRRRDGSAPRAAPPPAPAADGQNGHDVQQRRVPVGQASEHRHRAKRYHASRWPVRGSEPGDSASPRLRPAAVMRPRRACHEHQRAEHDYRRAERDRATGALRPRASSRAVGDRTPLRAHRDRHVPVEDQRALALVIDLRGSAATSSDAMVVPFELPCAITDVHAGARLGEAEAAP